MLDDVHVAVALPDGAALGDAQCVEFEQVVARDALEQLAQRSELSIQPASRAPRRRPSRDRRDGRDLERDDDAAERRIRLRRHARLALHAREDDGLAELEHAGAVGRRDRAWRRRRLARAEKSAPVRPHALREELAVELLGLHLAERGRLVRRLRHVQGLPT